jgi:hypothetical protein
MTAQNKEADARGRSSREASVTVQGTELRQAGALNVYATMPCPLKVRFKAEFETFIAEYNASHSQPVYCPTILDGAPKAIEDLLRAATCEEELPDLWVTTGFHTLFSRDFKRRFIDSGVLLGVTKPECVPFLPPEFQRVASTYNIGFLAFGGWELICDTSLTDEMLYPKSWSDLAKPEFRGKVSIHGYHGKASGASLLLVLQERMGQGAIREFARNIGAVRHFAEIIKSLDSSDPQRLAFNILPNAASRQIPSKKRVVQLEFKDGPLMAPLMLFVKRSKLEACRDLLGFFWGDKFRSVLAGGDFLMPDQMDWLRNYTFPSWDYLASRDFAELSEELNAEFRAGLAPGILPPERATPETSVHSKES